MNFTFTNVFFLETKKNTNYKSLVSITFLILLSLPTFAQKWNIINYSDCHLILEDPCSGATTDSYDPSNLWAGNWTTPGTTSFGNCNCPLKLTIVNNTPPIVLNPISNATQYCCDNKIPEDCVPNNCFTITISGCTITISPNKANCS